MVGVTGSGIEDVLNGISSILWPGVALTAIFIFRTEIRDLLRRLRKGKLLGQEIELDESLDRLAHDTEALASEPIAPVASVEPQRAVSPTVAAAQPESGGPFVIDLSNQADGMETPREVAILEEQPSSEKEIEEVLAIAATSPKAALMRLSVVLEQTARRFLAATGYLAALQTTPTLSAMAGILGRVTSLPRGMIDVFRDFSQIRNEIVHGRSSATDDEILRAVDSGIVLLRALVAIPRERNFVIHPGVPIYADKDGQLELTGRAVILRTLSPGGVVTTVRVFPTLRAHFIRGSEVAWEWNPDQVWNEAWYRDPDSGELKYAWTSSMEFIGRNLTDV